LISVYVAFDFDKVVVPAFRVKIVPRDYLAVR